MRDSNQDRHSIHGDERGIALAIALMAIVLVGALVTGTFFAGRMEIGAGRNSIYTAQATEAAETGLSRAFSSWDIAWNNYAVNTPTVQATVYPQSGVGNSSLRYTTTVLRMSGGVFMISSQGEKLDRGGNVMATRYLAQLAKVVKVSIDIQAAVTANADVTVSGNTTKIDGFDQLPAGWSGECAAPVPGTGVYGIRTSAQVSTNGSPDIYGTPTPMKENDATVTTTLFTDPFNALTPVASIVLSSAGGTQAYAPGDPTTTGSPAVCDKSNMDNWGEPYRTGGYVAECIDYYPVVYYPGPGTLKLSNGRAQGIILSAGNIDIAGNFEFNGIMLALGSIDTHGTGNKVSGAILSGNANISDDDALAGTPTILYSSCAVQKALSGAARGIALRERSWAQVNPL